MKLTDYSPDRIHRMADALGSSYDYVWQIVTRRRLASPRFAARMMRVDQKLRWHHFYGHLLKHKGTT